MKPLLKLSQGDHVEIIAPASRCSDQHLDELQALLTSWSLNCSVSPDIFGNDLLCANTDAIRFQLLKNALFNPDTKAIICARGGYGCMRLIPELAKLKAPIAQKLFVGMSDITALHLYLQQAWQWPVIHGALAKNKFSKESIAALKSILFGKTIQQPFAGSPLNLHATKTQTIHAAITGGNLSIVQASIGTPWQIQSDNKIIFLEEINERGYRVDRMLEHLSQANIFQHATAIIFGDFLEGKEPNGNSLIQPVLERFANSCDIPVIQIHGIGHGHINFPLVLGIESQLNLGNKITLD